jgi:hypothetical protein
VKRECGSEYKMCGRRTQEITKASKLVNGVWHVQGCVWVKYQW